MSVRRAKVARVIGGALGGKAGKAARKSADDPLVGAAVGAATMFVANRLLPAKVAAIGAAIAAGYVMRKLAQRAERIAERAVSSDPTPATIRRPRLSVARLPKPHLPKPTVIAKKSAG